MADLFVSYAREDAMAAERLVAVLVKRGWSVFWDRTIPAGKQWDDVLKRQLRRARCVIVLWSGHSIASEWVLHEASIARYRGNLVPAFLEAVLDRDRIAAVFGSIQAVPLEDLRDGGGATATDLIRAVERVIGRPKKRLWWSVLALLTALLIWKGRAGINAINDLGQSAGHAVRNERIMDRAGVRWLSWGPFDADENDRDFRMVREAHTIDMIATNATLFASNFRSDLKAFFRHPDAHMRVIFASGETPFYEQMAAMTGRIWENADARLEDILRIERSKQELLGDTVNNEQIEFRYFDTQYRMPIILIDGKYCILTVRLPPDEGQESLRIEADEHGVPTMASNSKPDAKPRLLPHVAESCRAHFERMWEQSPRQPAKYPKQGTIVAQ